MSDAIIRDIPGYEGLYQVDTEGNIYNRRGKTLKSSPRNKGYLMVMLRKDGAYHNVSVHRAVAMAFIGMPQDGEQVNHKDGDKTNNALCNLEWVTQSENVKHAYITGLRKNRQVDMYDKSGNHLRRFRGLTEAAQYCGANNLSVLWKACNGIKPTAYGFIWRYAGNE